MSSGREGPDKEAPATEEQVQGPERPPLVQVDDRRPEGYEGSCLRPMGLCDLGSCDACWYAPDHPRFQEGAALTADDGERKTEDGRRTTEDG